MDCEWKRGDEEDDEADKVYESKVDDGFVASNILICNDCSNDWGDVAPELEEVRQPHGTLCSQIDGSGDEVWIVPVSDDISCRAVHARIRVRDIVVERTTVPCQ